MQATFDLLGLRTSDGKRDRWVSAFSIDNRLSFRVWIGPRAVKMSTTANVSSLVLQHGATPLKEIVHGYFVLER